MSNLKTIVRAAAIFIPLWMGVGVAHAGEAPLDEVALQNGGVVKGEIIVMEPGEKVVIKVPGEDEPRTIPWSEVSDVQRGGAQAAPEEKKAPAAEEPRKQGRGVVKVHIDSEDPNVYLVQHRVAGSVVTQYGTIVGLQSSTVCHAPCDKVIDASPDDRYTIAGDEIRPSDPFSLHQYEGDVTASVEPSSSVLAGLGSTASVIGGLGLLGGIFTTVFAYTDIIEDPIAKPVGVGVLVGGAALLTGGIVMVALSGTDVEIAPKSNGKQARKPQYWRGEF
ncbi:MAG TPA: hypothetical protein VFB62_26575 [Polyangiaceae bacterium]|nr:hypothetical protein [Polyangiaceae bacterium]